VKFVFIIKEYFMFSVVGVSTQNGITKVRFANDIVSRTKVLAKGGHSPLELIELPNLMTKYDACQYLLDRGGVFAQWSGLIIETMSKKDDKAPAKTPAKAPAKKPAAVPTKAPAPAKQPKITKPAKAEDDLEITEIKTLAEVMAEPALV
jgi:hypothetical protein